MKVADLEFSLIVGKYPMSRCNHCGRKGVVLAADIPLSESGSIVLVVCSSKCEQAFKAHPKAQEYLDDLIAKVKSQKGGKPIEN
jgi:hypothetical protein